MANETQTADPMDSWILGAGTGNIPQASNEPSMDIDSWIMNPPAYKAPATPKQFTNADIMARLATRNLPQIPQSVQQQAGGLGKSVTAFLDNTVGAVIPYGAKQIGYLFGRTIGDTPETAEKISNRMADIVSKPFGKAFGVADTPEYKNEATGKLFEFVGNNVSKGSGWISQQTGLPKSDIEWMINTALPKVAEKGGRIVAETGRELKDLGQFAKDVYKDQKVIDAWEKTDKTVPFEQFAADYAVQHPSLKQQFVNKFEELKAGAPKLAEEAPKMEAPKVEGEVPVIEIKGVGQVPEVKPLEVPKEVPENRAEISPLKAEEVAANEQLLRDVGIENIRNSAVEMNPKEASSQYITSKAEQGPYGQGMTEQINHEKAALTNHFGKVEGELGGTVPRTGTAFEVTDRIEAGKKVKGAIESAQEAHQAKTTELYKKAEQAHGDKPVDIPGLSDFIKGDENFVYAPEQALQKGIQSYLKRQKLLDENGNVRPMTVVESEGLRKFINKNYNYETKNISAEIKNIIDDGVFESVGGETFKEARQHFQKGKEIYDNPKAIRDLLSDEGVNQKIADEKVINKIVTLDESQFAHMVDVLKETGQKDAMNQVQTSLVNRIKEAGQSSVNEPWNSIAAAKERAKLSEKLRVAFADNPDVLARIDKGIEAGNLLYIPNKYPGAAVQSHLMQNKFVDIGLRKAGTAIGGFLGGGTGALAGEMAGSKISGALSKGKQAKQLGKEIKFKEQQEGSNKASDFGLKP